MIQFAAWFAREFPALHKCTLEADDYGDKAYALIVKGNLLRAWNAALEEAARECFLEGIHSGDPIAYELGKRIRALAKPEGEN
jgi:hypothetical protein